MFRRFALAGALVVAALVAAPLAAADGPMPYASQGGSGVAMPDGLTRLVAVGVGAAGVPQSRTELEVIQTTDGMVRNWVDLRGSWGLPIVNYSQSAAEGLSADGKTLVLGDVDPARCGFRRHWRAWRNREHHSAKPSKGPRRGGASY